MESVLLFYRLDQKPGQPYPKVIPEPSDEPELDLKATVPSPTLHCTLGRGSGWSKEALTRLPSSVSPVHFQGPLFGWPSILYLCLPKANMLEQSREGTLEEVWPWP